MKTSSCLHVVIVNSVTPSFPPVENLWNVLVSTFSHLSCSLSPETSPHRWSPFTSSCSFSNKLHRWWFRCVLWCKHFADVRLRSDTGGDVALLIRVTKSHIKSILMFIKRSPALFKSCEFHNFRFVPVSQTVSDHAVSYITAATDTN